MGWSMQKETFWIGVAIVAVGMIIIILYVVL